MHRVQPGDRFRAEIEAAIRGASWVVFLVSNSWLDSPECQNELALALRHHGGPERFVPLLRAPFERLRPRIPVPFQALNLVEWTEHEGARPALGFDESFKAIVALHEHEGFKAALAARGITDLAKVQIDPWPTGRFGVAGFGYNPWTGSFYQNRLYQNPWTGRVGVAGSGYNPWTGVYGYRYRW